MSVVFGGLFKAVAKQYQGIVAARCAAVGLKYEDLLLEGPDLNHALERISPQVKEERERRIKRAFDCSVKRKTLPYENQPKDPLDMYLDKELVKAKLEREERAILNSY